MPGQRVGVGVYVTELLRALDPLNVDVHAFVNARDAEDLSGAARTATIHAVRLPNRPARLLWSQSVLPARVKRLRPDVFHGPHYTVPRLRCPSVVTFHDPTFFTLPHLHERSKVAYFTRAARTGIARATRVIAVSEYARRGAIEHGRADAAKIDTVYEGVDASRYHPDGEGRPFDFEPYVLFVGAIEPRKDVPTLIAAYEGLVQNGLPHHLVLAGPPAWGAAAVDAAVGRLRGGTVHRLSYVPEDQKIELYRRASLFVYPSIAEGFGLPVLEAMACGAPVVTTSGSAPEEVAGDAALLVSSSDADALREAMHRVLTDEQVAADLSRRGLVRAQSFSWSRTAEQTLGVYRVAAGLNA
jgi:glycosyltransferase involved in cell wall biosynthesis